MKLANGTLLHGGTYKIMSVLGQGSFGITYLAEHTSLGRKVCIKEFFMKELNSRCDDGSITGLSDGSLSYNYAQKFRKEAQNLARMEHPNIVRVTDSFDENGTFYYVMEYIDGQNLNEYVKNQAVSESEAISIIKDVANALIYMHEEKHMLHLDLKPGNIMRRASDGHIFLIDFGLSKSYSEDGQPETSTTIGLGTAGYAPIEQSTQTKHGEFRATIDVYALGATMFKILTRETPPVASELVSNEELLISKMQEYMLPSEIESIICDAMNPNVKQRIPNIRKFINRFDEPQTVLPPRQDLLTNRTRHIIIAIAICLIGLLCWGYFTQSPGSKVKNDKDESIIEKKGIQQEGTKTKKVTVEDNKSKTKAKKATGNTQKEDLTETGIPTASEAFANAKSSGNLSQIIQLADNGYSPACTFLANYYFESHNYSLADSYAKKGNASSVIKKLRDLGYYD